jgi:parallel beta-helix repeat protein
MYLSISETISGNSFQNNSMGGICIFQSSPDIYNNNITGNSNGIYCEGYSYPYIYSNRISDNSYGVFSDYYSSTKLVSPGAPFGQGRNVILSNGVGITSALNNEIFAGSVTLGGGYNSIYGNRMYNAASLQGSQIIAQLTWWGYYPPPQNSFQHDNTSILDTSFSLNYNPNGSLLKKGNSNNILSDNLFFDEELTKAYKYIMEKKYPEAYTLYRNIYEREGGSAKGKYSLIKMEECYSKAGKGGEFKEYLNNSVRSKAGKNDEIYSMSLELENHILLNEKNYSKVIENLNILKTNFKDKPETYKHAIFNLGYINYLCLKNPEKGSEYFKELEEKYPNDPIRVMVSAITGKAPGSDYKPQSGNNANSNNKQGGKENTDSLTASIANYPNPFNPSTNIVYTIPENSKVKLIVYNALGQEVETLVNKEQTAGKYVIVWNPKNIASGVYYYRLTVNNHSKIRKLIFMK